mmetsp:Transcript_27482/g.27702  ORF Transcript_27482/g.27702 Transcript_27482/m.27702 type:complete len:193 (+) Transcript_27482:74-652(+)
MCAYRISGRATFQAIIYKHSPLSSREVDINNVNASLGVPQMVGLPKSIWAKKIVNKFIESNDIGKSVWNKYGVVRNAAIKQSEVCRIPLSLKCRKVSISVGLISLINIYINRYFESFDPLVDSDGDGSYSDISSNSCSTRNSDSDLSCIQLVDLLSGQEYKLTEKVLKNKDLMCIQYESSDELDEYPPSLRF